ncbi:MAG: Hsp20/alpha crystallin family protein [Phycisphaerae bacterium]
MLPGRFIQPNNSLFSWDPFQELESLTRSLGASDAGLAGPNGFRVDVREEDDRYVVQADLPGFSRDAVEVTFENGVLTISGEVRSDQQQQDETFHLRERRYGRVSRSFAMPEEVDTDNIQATMADGVLTVTLTKTPAAQPRKITVKAD